MKNVSRLSAVLAAALVSACGGEPPADSAETQTPAAATTAATATVTIASPTDGSAITSADVTVTLTVDGMQIVPAGEMAPGTGHHHLYLDADLTAPGTPGAFGAREHHSHR